MIGRIAACGLALAMAVVPARSETWVHPIAKPLCASLVEAVDAEAAPGKPMFLRSYKPGPDETDLPEPLRQSAFSYDNALAAIALVSCGDLERARRIGDAFLVGLHRDRTFHDGRIRNAYRSGAVAADAVALPGWWDHRAKLWAEDAYQDGTSTGNVAWVALALLTLRDATGAPDYLGGAQTLLDWIATNARRAPGPDGFSGGLDGFDGAQKRLEWKSTEHNLDVHAAATWLGRLTADERLPGIAAVARGFLDAAFVPTRGLFLLGTSPDGRLRDQGHLALDTQLWPLLAVRDPPAEWRRALPFAETTMGVEGGFDFNEDRDGLWVEGTAQAALTYRSVGGRDRAAKLLDGLKAQISPSGYLYATREPRLTTGLSIGPNSGSEDFYYFRRPHLGATAWAILAARGWNPFTGRQLD